MSIEGILVTLVVLAVVGLWVGVPLFRRDSSTTTNDLVTQKQFERLLAYYERVLRNIRDLEEDHVTGKMNTEEYEAEREYWTQRGIQALKSLDQFEELTLDVPETLDAHMMDAAIDDAIESAVAAYRSKSPG